MPIKFPALAALCLAVSAPAALADEAPRTVTDYANLIVASAARLDVMVTDRQKDGDMAVAQRLVLTAAMLRRAGEEFRSSEQDSMTGDVSGLSEPVPQRLAAVVAKAAEAETRAAADPAFVEEAQRTVNALMAALPMKPPHPLFFGVLSRDLADSPLPSDLVIYGYRMIDPLLKIPPVVLFNKTEISDLAIKSNRIEVTLPPDIKKAVGFAPPPCESRAGFSVRVTDSYIQQRGIWPISWKNQIESTEDLFVLPTPVFFTAKIATTVEETAVKTSTVPIEQKSDMVSADCEETRRAEIAVPLPVGFKNLTCSAEWVDASGAARLASHCATVGQTLRVTGEIVGGMRACSPDKLCSCPTSAKGFLQAKGSYEVPMPGETVKVEAQARPLTFPAGSLAQDRVDSSNRAKLRHVALSLSRRACPTEVDDIVLNLGDDPHGGADATSKTGAFRALIEAGKLTVGAIDAYPTALDKSP